MDPMNILAKFEVHSFTRSQDNSDWSFGWGRTQSWGRGGRYLPLFFSYHHHPRL